MSPQFSMRSFKTYQARIDDLIRIATGGTGNLPEGELHPDLVNRIAQEASRTAQAVLNMCIRAFEYLPPIDITFGDYLRALVTADFELSPSDEIGLRANMIEAFRARGIYPDNVASLAEESLRWESSEDSGLPSLPIYDDPDKAAGADPKQTCLSAYWLESFLDNAYEASSSPDTQSSDALRPDVKHKFEKEGEAADEEEGTSFAIVRVLMKYAEENAVALDLDPDRTISVEGFHPVFRVNPRGQLLVEMVAQFTQRHEEFQENYDVSGGLNLRGGTTVIASANGVVRYVISKPLESESFSLQKNAEAKMRRERQEAFVRELDQTDTNLTWSDSGYFTNRITRRLNFKAIHSTLGK